MVYIGLDKRLCKEKRNNCCKIIPENNTKLQRLINERKKHIAKDLIKDIKHVNHHEVEKLRVVEEKLKRKRRKAEYEKIEMMNQWNDLKKEEENFRCAFVDFHKFVIENRERLERETIKLKNHKAYINRTQLEIEKRRRITEHFHIVYERMNIEIRKHLIYEKFLDAYADEVKAKSIDDILYRYALLLESRDNMDHTTREKEKNLRRFCAECYINLHQWYTEMVKFHEKLTLQSEMFEEAKRNVMNWEKTLCDIRTNAHKIWSNLETTRDALNNITRLLLIRRMMLSPEDIRKNEKLKDMLTTTADKMLYMNKALGDLMKVKKELWQHYPEEKKSMSDDESEQSEQIIYTTSPSTEKLPPKETVCLRKIELKSKAEFHKLSRGTLRILQTLERQLLRSSRSSSRHSRFSSTCSTQLKKFSSSSYGDNSTARRIKTGANKKNMQQIEVEKSKSPAAAKDSSIQPNVENLPLYTRAEIPLQYSDVTVTTDPSYLLEERRTKLRDKIVDRNFERYEKHLQKRLFSDSSVLKINKETGKLELPKFKIKQTQTPRRKSTGITLPRIELENARKLETEYDYLKRMSSLSVKSRKDFVNLDELRLVKERFAVKEIFHKDMHHCEM